MFHSLSNVSFNFSHKFGATKLRDKFHELCSVTVFIFLRMPWLFLDLLGKTVWKISKPQLKKIMMKIRLHYLKVALVAPVYESSERNVYSIYRSICFLIFLPFRVFLNSLSRQILCGNELQRVEESRLINT